MVREHGRLATTDDSWILREVALDVRKLELSQDALWGLALEEELKASPDQVLDCRVRSEALYL